jgi:hypothetical protein
VAPQYCGALGKIANCQEGVFAVYASPHGYAFVDGRLYVPERWFADDYRARRKVCGLPTDLQFQSEPELALAMLAELLTGGHLPFRWITANILAKSRPFWTELRRPASGTRSKSQSTLRFGCSPSRSATWSRLAGAFAHATARGPERAAPHRTESLGGAIAALGLAPLDNQGS